MKFRYGFAMLQDSLNVDGGQGGGTGSAGAAGASDTTGNNNGDATTGNAGGVDWSKWMEALPDDVRKDTGLSTIKTLPDLAKGYINLQKTLGKDKIQVPDAKHATEKDYLDIFRKLGSPEKLEDYKFKMPDGIDDKSINTDFMDKIKAAAHTSGILPWQFEKIFGAYHGYASKMQQDSADKFKATQEADIGALKQEWGKGYETELKKANIAFKELLPNAADRQRLADDGLLTHPTIIKALASASKLLKDDVFVGHGSGNLSGITPADALKRAREIQGDANHPYRNPAHPNYKAAKEEVAGLYKTAFPE